MHLRLGLIASLAAIATASNVIEATSATFNSIVGAGKPALVEFFAPWCGHCKNLAPIYEQVADAFAHAKDKVVIVKVDADGEGKDIAKTHEVQGYPTLKWFGANDAVKSDPYEGGRELDDLIKFITDKTGVKSNIKPPPPPATLQLDYRTFDDVVYNESKNVLVTFTAPWCGHCKNLKPQLEKVAINFAGESDCVVANFDADAQQNKDIANKFDVKSYPTIKFFPAGAKEPIAYEGGRSEAAFTDYLNEKCGTFRHPGGGLNDKAGRVATLDTAAQSFIAAATDARQTIYDDAVKTAESVGDAGKHYLKVMEKIIKGGDAYIEKEAKRLTGILAKKTLSEQKLDELKVKANILSAFVAKKVEEAEEKVEEVADKIKDEL
ncbi:protein disulfide isomerase [Auriculariales sp. MPI-PUGE-AT-0066]|nr:protein disulfide isomerase [Auriculariales sp. MPI-PUGE-AT-0066]